MAKSGGDEFHRQLKSLGANIKAIRIRANLTQEDMAEEPYPIEFRNYQRIEAGEQNVTFKTLFRLSKKLGCEIEAFTKNIS